MLKCKKILSQRFLKIYLFSAKYLVINQRLRFYWEQMFTRLYNLNNNHCWQDYNGLILL